MKEHKRACREREKESKKEKKIGAVKITFVVVVRCVAMFVVDGILPVRLVRVSHTNRHETNTLNVRNSAPAPLVQLYAFTPR